MVGVSGGADSVGLLLLLRELVPEYNLLLHVVHLNHMLRPEAAVDAAFVQQLAHQWGLPITIGYARVRAVAGRLRIGIEEAGRLARYQLFEQVADRIGAQRIAVGHHADDQVETVLFNIMRGTGPEGLAGIPPRHGRIVRPLLCASKEEIVAYCRDAGLDWRTDASNLSPEFQRNRIRHYLLPLLRKEFNPHIDQAILRLAQITGEENRFLTGYVQSLLQRLLVEGESIAKAARSAPANLSSGVNATVSGDNLTETPGSELSSKTACLPLSSFQRLPLSLQRRLLRAAVRRAGGRLRHLGYQNVEDCLVFLGQSGPGGFVELPHGVRVRKNSACFTVAIQGTAAASRGRSQSEAAARRNILVPLKIPGNTSLAELGLTIRARLVNIAPGAARCPVLERRGASRLWETGDGTRACFDYDRLELPLTVRTRRDGDRLRPYGMQGTKKLKKLLGELRVPGGSRDRIALVISQSQILWVVGYRRAEAAPLTRQTRRVLILEAERM